MSLPPKRKILPSVEWLGAEPIIDRREDVKMSVLSVESLINTKFSFITSAGMFSGLVVNVEKLDSGHTAYGLQDVIFRPSGNIRTAIRLPECAVYGPQISGTTDYVEPMVFEDL
jgi:hypothetical protein